MFPSGGSITFDPAGLSSPSVIGLPYTVLRTSDTSARTNNTLTNDDGTGGTLKFTIGTSATETYFVEAFLYFNAANGTMDIKVGWNATGLPASATANWGAQAGVNAVGPNVLSGFAGISTATVPPAITAIGGTVAVGSVTGTNGLGLAGTFFGGGTGGDIVFAWAQNTTDAGNLVLKAGSFLRVTKLRA